MNFLHHTETAGKDGPAGKGSRVMFQQVELSFASDALEPHIDTLTMETHYGKHHATYTKALNEAAEKAGVTDQPIEKLLSSLDSVEDPALRKALRNNGGGYYNHNLYFSVLSPSPKKEPEGALKEQIEKAFGDLDSLKAQLKAAAVGQFGSGWAWLNTAPDGTLSISQSPNQDNPFSEGSDLVPILAVDVWEHAYYLKYKNLRADYIDALFEVVDWAAVEDNYQKARG